MSPLPTLRQQTTEKSGEGKDVILALAALFISLRG
jgi:hypothetical protein